MKENQQLKKVYNQYWVMKRKNALNPEPENMNNAEKMKRAARSKILKDPNKVRHNELLVKNIENLTVGKVK